MVEPISILAVALALATVGYAWLRRVPMVMALTIANFLVFVLALLAGSGVTLRDSALLHDLATRVSYLKDQEWDQLYTILTSTLLHADFFHIVGNMLVLLMIGLPFEDRVGRGRFLAIYAFSAVVAVILHSIWILTQGTEADLGVPLVGASGAVFGILGAFAAMYPRDQIPMFLIVIFLQRVPVWVAAVVLMGLEGFFLFGSSTQHVAHAAHLGGAVGGVILGLLVKPRQPLVEARGEPHRIDYSALERLGPEPHQRALLEKLKANEDHADVQKAWLDRLVDTLACPRCGEPLERGRAGRLRCPNGHQESYGR